jgi:glycosyltransferase involved in cell wall biosynthesis
MEFPRILVVTSNNFNLVTGGGITLTNLFRGWPSDRIANLHEDSQPTDTSVCQRFYRLTGQEIHVMWPFSMAVSNRNGTAALTPDNGLKTSKALMLSRSIFGDGVPRKFVASPALKLWLDEFQPQLIYSFTGSMAQIRITAALTERYKARLAVHIMDDWPGMIYRRGLFGSVLRHQVLSEFKTLLGQASVRLAICQDMCDDYVKTFGREFKPFHNAVDLCVWRGRSRNSWTGGRPFVVRYAGSILEESQRDALAEMCFAVAALRNSGNDLEMWVHSPANQREYLEELRFDGLYLEDTPDPMKIVELLGTADLLVLPFNFDSRSTGYMRLSMPTKIPAYMASGTPVLVYGPANIAPVRYALRDGWAYVVSERGVDAIQAALQKLIGSASLREGLGRRAQEIAAERHDAARVRTEFQMLLTTASDQVYAD